MSVDQIPGGEAPPGLPARVSDDSCAAAPDPSADTAFGLDRRLDSRSSMPAASFRPLATKANERCRLARRVFRFSIVAFLAATFGCGRVGDPQPPFVRIPAAADDLSVEQVGYELHFRWTNPLRNVDQSATDLARALIRANDELVATVDVAVPGQTQAHVIPGRGLIGIERRYSISFETSESRISLPSNVVALAVVDVPGGGAAPEATVDQGRVRLDWVEPPARADLVGGYRVYRLGELLTPEPIGDTRFDDVAFEAGARYRYTVVGVRRVGTRLIEGVLYRDVEVTAVDRVPPETPTGLRIVPYDGGVFVQWEPGAATDIVRYLVYRRNGPEAEFGIANTDEQAIPFFPDPGYRPGFQYAVSAVDQAGNRSPISEAVSGF